MVSLTTRIPQGYLSFSPPKVMGILNITPDSFYRESRTRDVKPALEQAERFLREGADLLDVGGWSSRPGAAPVSIEEEVSRIQPVIKALKKQYPNSVISVDTARSEVAKVALCEGADVINDAAGGQDEALFPLIAEHKAAYVLMHTRGTPQTMQGLTEYENILQEVTQFFQQKLERLAAAGVQDVILDPGFGFAKTSAQGFELLQKLESLQQLGYPLLVGVSRKSMIYKTLENTPQEALNGTTALHVHALKHGASILRVHDVREAVEVRTLCEQLKYFG